MRKFLLLGILMAVVLFAVPVRAQEETTKGASEQARERANDNAIFNRVPDWFATVGKSDEEKEKILAERRAEREAKRLEKEAGKLQREAEQEARKAQKQLEEAQGRAKGKMGAAGKDMEGFMQRQGKGKK